VTAERPDSPADLPATYQNPWGLLGQDLRAVVADLGLQLRALWRRNREGDLSVPGFWPRPLQVLFWPLLLALLLALPWIGWRLLPRSQGPSALPGPVAAPTSDLSRPFVAAGTDRSPQRLAALPPEDSNVPSPEPGTTARESREEAGPLPAAPLEPPPPELALDPLVQLLAEADPQQLIVSAHPEPAQSLLRLTLAPAYGTLPPAGRRQWADRWSERALDLGYENFELVDGQQRLLGRKALVGSGMILLDPMPRL